MRCVLLLTFLCASVSACQPMPAGVGRLDADYGFEGYVLGDSLYSSVIGEAERTRLDYDVLEFETAGSRFADQLPLPVSNDRRMMGVSLTRSTAGVIDGQVYALLFQLESGTVQQRAMLDSLIARYGIPTAVYSNDVAGAGMLVQIDQRHWEGERVVLAYGMGEGYAELLVYDRQLRGRRLSIQRAIAAGRDAPSPALDALQEVGSVQLQITEPFATWRYQYRRTANPDRRGAVGMIDYSLVQSFFGVQGRSLYGLDMARVALYFLPKVDSLVSMEVRFDNSQGQTIGFFDMLRTLERKMGRAPYSDTLHTKKGPFCRAIWYGREVQVVLEEYRLQPGQASVADVVVRFEVRREAVELDPDWQPPVDPDAAPVASPHVEPDSLMDFRRPEL
ncbi:MAG: hypothetical protein SH809_01850 [Rhodothermales bacterium]|nr:hypothetical protein [Rhodothermales bacterium]